MVPANPDPSGKWLLKQRERESHVRTVYKYLICLSHDKSKEIEHMITRFDVHDDIQPVWSGFEFGLRSRYTQFECRVPIYTCITHHAVLILTRCCRHM